MSAANALIGLGSNLGERETILDAALEKLRETASHELYRHSPWLETLPVGGPPDQAPFLNGVAWLKTSLSPVVLLQKLHDIENALGRERHAVWGPRTLDLDLLLYDDLILNDTELQIPHRWFPFRSFVLDPAVVIAPDWIHPILQKSIYDLRVQLRAIPYWFVIGGGSIAGRERLAASLARQFQGFHISVLNPQEQLEGELPLRELPPRGIFISSIDWTQDCCANDVGLKLQMPASDSMPATAWRLDPGSKAWPLPKARLQLCNSAEEFLATDYSTQLLPLYQALSPLPTLNLLESNFEQLFDQAATMIAALTPDREQQTDR
jgi:2-amino-4-hydroxy-6-hydroxymethyldihydropteridine diphosphokinase